MSSLLLAWQVRHRNVLVVGGGEVALSRVRHLVVAGAVITVVAPDAGPEIRAMAGEKLTLLERPFESHDLTMYHKPLDVGPGPYTAQQMAQIDAHVQNCRFEVVCCCIDDHELSTQIYYQCKVLGLNANIADKPPLCDFYFGSMINNDSVQIMISTNGKSPRLSRLVRNSIEKQFDGVDLGRAADVLNDIRQALRALLPANDVETIEKRMEWIKALTDYFSVREWSQIAVDPQAVVAHYPELPPKSMFVSP